MFGGQTQVEGAEKRYLGQVRALQLMHVASKQCGFSAAYTAKLEPSHNKTSALEFAKAFLLLQELVVRCSFPFSSQLPASCPFRIIIVIWNKNEARLKLLELPLPRLSATSVTLVSAWPWRPCDVASMRKVGEQSGLTHIAGCQAPDSPWPATARWASAVPAAAHLTTYSAGSSDLPAASQKPELNAPYRALTEHPCTGVHMLYSRGSP